MRKILHNSAMTARYTSIKKFAFLMIVLIMGIDYGLRTEKSYGAESGFISGGNDLSYWSAKDPNTGSDDEKSIRALIEKFKISWDTFDKELLNSVLSKKFKFYYAVDDSTVYTQDRRRYLRKRRGWQVGKQSDREMKISNPVLFSTKSNKNDIRLAVWCSMELNSKYFGPKFFTQFEFERKQDKSGHWRLVKEVQTLINPKEPMDHEVSIFIGKARPNPPGHLKSHQMMSWSGADVVVGNYISEVYNTHVPDNRITAVLAIFREPPRAGSEVSLIYRYGNGYIKEGSKVKAIGGSPWFFVSEYVYFSGTSGSVEAEVRVNGKTVKKKKMQSN